MNKQKVVEYISMTQPLLEKTANQNKRFSSSLKAKLRGRVQQGVLTKEAADKMYRDALRDPSSILNHLDLPVASGIGKVASMNDTHSVKRDAFYRVLVDNEFPM